MLLNRRGFATRGVLPPVRGHARLPQLQRVADRPWRGTAQARAVPLLQLLDARAEDVSHVRRRRSRAGRASAPSASKPKSRARVPGARVARVDRDTMRRRGAIGRCSSRFRGGEIDVLVGTQMIAKGHDFPRVTLVGVDLSRRRPRPGRFPRGASGRFSCSRRSPAAPAAASSRARRSSRRFIPTTTHPAACRQDYAAFFEQRDGVPRRRCAIRRWSLINVIVQGTNASTRRWPTPPISSATADGSGEACACSGRRRRRSAGSRASIGRSSS